MLNIDAGNVSIVFNGEVYNNDINRRGKKIVFAHNQSKTMELCSRKDFFNTRTQNDTEYNTGLTFYHVAYEQTTKLRDNFQVRDISNHDITDQFLKRWPPVSHKYMEN